jgi:hypothetical protein
MPGEARFGVRRRPPPCVRIAAACSRLETEVDLEVVLEQEAANVLDVEGDAEVVNDREVLVQPRRPAVRELPVVDPLGGANDDVQIGPAVGVAGGAGTGQLRVRDPLVRTQELEQPLCGVVALLRRVQRHGRPPKYRPSRVPRSRSGRGAS